MTPRGNIPGRARFGTAIGGEGGIPLNIQPDASAVADKNRSPSGDLVRGPSGELLDTRAEWMEVQVTEHVTEDGTDSRSKYSWKRIYSDADASGGITDAVNGEGTKDGDYLEEINGRLDVPVGVNVKAMKSQLGPYWVFQHQPPVLLAQCLDFPWSNYTVPSGVSSITIPLNSVDVNFPQDYRRRTYLVSLEGKGFISHSGSGTYQPGNSGTPFNAICYLEMAWAKYDGSGTLPTATNWHGAPLWRNHGGLLAQLTTGGHCLTMDTFDSVANVSAGPSIDESAPVAGVYDSPDSTIVMSRLRIVFDGTIDNDLPIYMQALALRVFQLDKILTDDNDAESCGPVGGESDPPPPPPPPSTYPITLFNPTKFVTSAYPTDLTITESGGAHGPWTQTNLTPPFSFTLNLYASKTYTITAVRTADSASETVVTPTSGIFITDGSGNVTTGGSTSSSVEVAVTEP